MKEPGVYSMNLDGFVNYRFVILSLNFYISWENLVNYSQLDVNKNEKNIME